MEINIEFSQEEIVNLSSGYDLDEAKLKEILSRAVIIYFQFKEIEAEPTLGKQMKELNDFNDKFLDAIISWKGLSRASKETFAFTAHSSSELGEGMLKENMVDIDGIIKKAERYLKEVYLASDMSANSYFDKGGRPKGISLYALVNEIAEYWEAVENKIFTQRFDKDGRSITGGDFLGQLLEHIDPSAKPKLENVITEVISERKNKKSDGMENRSSGKSLVNLDPDSIPKLEDVREMIIANPPPYPYEVEFGEPKTNKR